MQTTVFHRTDIGSVTTSLGDIIDGLEEVRRFPYG